MVFRDCCRLSLLVLLLGYGMDSVGGGAGWRFELISGLWFFVFCVVLIKQSKHDRDRLFTTHTTNYNTLLSTLLDTHTPTHAHTHTHTHTHTKKHKRGPF